MSEFSDRPFMAGSLIGCRAFSVDSLGRLRGPAYDQVFRPGENVAECRKRDDAWSTAYRTQMARMVWSLDPGYSFGGHVPASSPASPTYYGGAGKITATFNEASKAIEAKSRSLAEEAVEREDPPGPPPHALAGLHCTCGFYAYYDGRNDYKSSETITALIEGYGVCTIGASGFRAEKARLVALVRPGKQLTEKRLDLIERNYPDVPLYDRKKDALAAHPLTLTDATPTPDLEDFWTREAKR